MLKIPLALKPYYSYVCERPEITFLITFQALPGKLKMAQPLSGQLVNEIIYCQSELRVCDLELK